MKILMISDVYFPRINGVSTSIQIFRQELINAGHEVTLIAPDYAKADVNEPDIIRIPSRDLLFVHEDRMMRSNYIRRLLPELKSRRYDLVHIQTPFVAHYRGIDLARQLAIPCVESYHTFFEEYLYHYVPLIPRAWMRLLARRFTRTQCNSVDQVIVPSTAMQEVLTNYGVSQPINILPTGMELHRFNRRTCDGNLFKQRYSIPPDRPMLVHIGRVAHEKNIGFLIQMLVELRRSVPDVLLVIAGEGPALASLKRLSARLGLTGNVLFVGYLDRTGMLMNCYCAGDVFVFSSRTETQGLVLLEAMALGVPVVSTAVLGTKDILEPRRGAIISHEDPELFANDVKRILDNAFLKERLSKEAVDYVKEWTAPIMAEKLLALYQRLTGDKSTPKNAHNGVDIKHQQQLGG